MGGATTCLVLGCLILGTSALLPDEYMRGFEFNDVETNLDDPKYRLTNAVQPRIVNVDLDVNLNTASFVGHVELYVETTEPNLTQMVLHQKVVSISTVSVTDGSGRPVSLATPEPFTTDDHYEIMYINFAGPIPMGRYVININYKGKINENQFERGFYRGHYFASDNTKKYYATTQFQPYYARMAFPCFDEPQFKSVYIISITRDAGLQPSYSNMAIATTETLASGRVKETFLPTPIVSTYLVAFTVSDFVATNHTASNTKPFQIVSRPGVEDQHTYAADIGLAITNALDDYFGIDYYEMGQGVPMKNDHLAIPDFPAGAMENWGMVNYREAYLLYDERHTNLNNKIFIATIMAHELAHKWFGNLVTCFWWSNLWLNESFASFFEYFGAHAADPNLELNDQFVVDYVHSALNWDSGAGATSMNLSSVTDNDSISGHFSTTSYAKGASVLKMMEHFLGERTFRTGLRYYLRDNSYGLGTPTDLYNALRRAASEDVQFRTKFPNVDIGQVLDSWVQNPGSPVVNVDVNMTTGQITVKQERFLLSGATPNPQRWHIPFTWTHSGELDFSSTEPKFLLSDESITLNNTAGHFWVIANIAQSGLYRVNYDDHNWQMMASSLRNNNNRQRIHKLNRAQIVNDVLHFVRAKKIDYKRAFDVLSFLRSETDYYVWAGALGQLNWIRKRFEHMPEAHERFTNYMLAQMKTVINSLGYEERDTDSTSTILNRMMLMNAACDLGHSGCISNSLQKWNNFRQNATYLVPVNQRRYVYCVGLRQGNGSDYQFLMQQYMTSQNTADMVVMLRALGCTNDNDSLKDYLQQTLVNDRIRLHDRTNAISYALQGNPENVKIVLDFIMENFQAIRTEHGGTARLNVNLNSLAGFLTDFEDITKFRTWLNENQVALGSSFHVGVGAMQAAVSNLGWGGDNALEIHTIVGNSAAVIATPFILLLAAVAAQCLRYF